MDRAWNAPAGAAGATSGGRGLPPSALRNGAIAFPRLGARPLRQKTDRLAWKSTCLLYTSPSPRD
eukprot:9887431-Alexandrium_andersonii.AAC.1